MRIAALGALLLLVAACGRVGEIRAPGPPDQVTFQRTYPSR